MWQTLLHPDHEELAMKERLVVISAANQLQVGEFQLLQLAYRAWHHKDLPEALVAKLFTSNTQPCFRRVNPGITIGIGQVFCGETIRQA